VGAGSCLEYDWNYGYCVEGKTPCTPHTVYGAAKHALQLVLTASAGADDLSVAWGRVFFLYGPGERPERLVPAVARALIAGERAKCSHGNQIRDYLFVDDVARAFVALLESDVTGPVNIASGQPLRLRDLVGRVGALIGRPDLIELGAVPAAPTDLPFVVADTARLSSGLEKTIAWWRAELAGTLSADSQA
jgi:nucleoside-diphosphate-sugar epimerase